MESDVIVFLLYFLLPGLAIIVFARKIVDWQAKLYPRWYGPVRKILGWLVLYAIGIWWIVRGVQFVARM